MKRTYVDIIGEYYDNQDDIQSEARILGIRDSDLKKVYKFRAPRTLGKIIEE